MSLETIISSALTRPDDDRRALVLMGGGARTAYQVGVLQALGSMLSLSIQHPENSFPFKILVGTSAGALMHPLHWFGQRRWTAVTRQKRPSFAIAL